MRPDPLKSVLFRHPAFTSQGASSVTFKIFTNPRERGSKTVFQQLKLPRCGHRDVFSERCATGMSHASLHGCIYGDSEKTSRCPHRSKGFFLKPAVKAEEARWRRFCSARWSRGFPVWLHRYRPSRRFQPIFLLPGPCNDRKNAR